jgi:hypothetical protein
MAGGVSTDAGRDRARRLLPVVVATIVLTVALVLWLLVVATQWSWITGSFAVDYRIYMDAVDRWMSGGGWYQDRQLHGPYEIALGDVLYPPVLLYLLVPFRFIGPALWSLIPAIVLTVAVLRHRPGAWAVAVIGGCLLWPVTPAKFIFGNPVIWAAAAVAAGTGLRWPSALVLIKPTIAPFALFGIRSRGWWIVVGVLAVLSLPFLADTLRYPQVLLDARTNPIDGRGGPLYSLQEYPLMAIPLIAWAGRRRRFG